MRAGDVIADRYELCALTGSGAMAKIYRARDRRSGEDVAVKVVQASGRRAARFVREAEVLSMLEHPAIVRYVGHGRAGDQHCYLAMEWLEGEDLAARLVRAGPLGAAETIALGARAAEALVAAHRRDVVHRDIKPSNLFLPNGDPARVKLLDFGVARAPEAIAALTDPGTAIGTPSFMAPEQARGEHIDARADVFALGCVLFACLTRRPPFLGRDVSAVLGKIVLEEAPRLRDLRPDTPETLEALVARMLAKHPDDRPSASAVVAALRDLPRSDVSLARRVGLGSAETDLVSVVLAGGGRRESGGSRPRLDAVAERHGAALSRLVDGSLLLALGGRGAVEQTVRAARCALELRAALDDGPVALATGRALVEGRVPVGEVIERAAALLRRRAPGTGVRVDEVSAGLLPPRFEVDGDEQGLVLTAERELAAPVRTLLGKPTPCVGRERELGLLALLAEQAFRTPEAAAALIIGPPGAGKSRLRYELVRVLEARFRGLQIWIGRGDPMAQGAPFSLVAQALGHLCGLRAGEPAEARRTRVRGRISRHVPATDAGRIAAFAGELVDCSFDDEEPLVRAARRDAVLMWDHIAQAFSELVAAETQQGPLLFVLEDLHWGDLPTVNLVDRVLRRLPDRPLVVLCVARPEVHARFPALFGSLPAVEIPVRALPPGAARHLVRAVLGAQPDDDAVERIVERAEGNALLLEELIRAEASGGRAPGPAVALLQERIDRLAPPARRVLRAASVFGGEFFRGGVSALLGGEDAGALLRALAKEELVSPRPSHRFPDDEEYTFRHELLREAAYGMLTGEDRTLGHRLAADWLERRGAADSATLAEHFEKGALPSRAVEHYLRAAREAIEGNDFDGAAARAERGLACGAEDAVRGELLAVLANAQRYQARHDLAVVTGGGALDLLPAGSAAWCRAATVLCDSLLGRSDVDALSRLGNRLLDIPLDAAERTGILARCARSLCLLDQTALADRLLDRVEPGPDDAAARAEDHRARTSRAMARGDLETVAIESFRTVQALEQAGNERGACYMRANLGYTLLELGRDAEAEQHLRAALRGAELLGLPHVAALARHNLGPAVARRGDHEEARRLEEAAVEAFHRQRDHRLEVGSRLYLSRILLAAGDATGAEREARAALAVEPPAPLLPFALAALAHAELRLGRVEGALARAADAIARSGRGWDSHEAYLRLVQSETLLAAGREEEAAAAASAARAAVLVRAERIASSDLRRSFLENVPDNARILELAERLADQKKDE